MQSQKNKQKASVVRTLSNNHNVFFGVWTFFAPKKTGGKEFLLHQILFLKNLRLNFWREFVKRLNTVVKKNVFKMKFGNFLEIKVLICSVQVLFCRPLTRLEFKNFSPKSESLPKVGDAASY